MGYIGFLIGIVIGKGFIGSLFAGLLGYFIGKLIETAFTARVVIHRQHQTQNDFTRTFLILCAEVMKADETLMRSELDYVRNFLIKHMGIQKAQAALIQLREILKTEYNIQQVCAEMQQKSTIHERLVTLQFLFGVAFADGNISQAELNRIEQISMLLNISRMDFESMKSMYMGGYQHQQSGYHKAYTANNLDNEYKILEVAPGATDDEIKKAYRNLAKKHHPDKVNHLGDEVRTAAEEKFARLNQAYERIKKARGIN